MARLGEDILEWRVDDLVHWLQQEGLDDCIGTFRANKINGRTLVNLKEAEIKALHHVSNESKKKLIKAIEKYKRKREEKMKRMFGGGTQGQTVHARRPASFSHEEDAGSDDDGWGSEEWDTDGSQDASSESDDGEYLEPEENQTKRGSLGRETASVPSGLVAQLRAGIANSLQRRPVGPGQFNQTPQEHFDDDEIYDVPPDEEELYEEPSDSSGGAVVVRPPPKKPPKPDDKGEYLIARGMEDDQETYETPLEEEDFSPPSPSRSGKNNRFIPTKVAQGSKFVPVSDVNENDTYDIPELEDDEDSYEIPGEQAAPPPRPPKNIGTKPPNKEPKQFPLKPKPQVSPPSSGGLQSRGPPPVGQSQGSGSKFQPQNSRPQTTSLSPQGTPFRSQPTPPRAGRPTPEPKKPEYPPKKSSLPNKMETAGQGRWPPGSPTKVSGEHTGAGNRESKIDSKLSRNALPVPGSEPDKSGPQPAPRAGILSKVPKGSNPPVPSPSPRENPPLPASAHRRPPAPTPTERPPPTEPTIPVETASHTERRGLPSVPLPREPPQQKTESVPPRPPKKNQPGVEQPALPPRHLSERQGVPLPPTPVASNAGTLKEQSSASSIESTSADEPIIPLQHLPKPSGKRSLPAPPTSQPKSPIELMKEAPWFQGPVDRKAVEASLKKSNKNGAFLVRNSTKNPNDYSMSLIYQGSVRHLRIPHKNNKYVLGDSGIQKFDTIIDLVNYYRQNELDLKTGGKTTLTVPCQVYKC